MCACATGNEQLKSIRPCLISHSLNIRCLSLPLPTVLHPIAVLREDGLLLYIPQRRLDFLVAATAATVTFIPFAAQPFLLLLFSYTQGTLTISVKPSP